jgi:heat shock protein HslJ
VLRRVGAVMVLFVLATGACGGSSDDSGARGDGLEGVEWVLDHDASTLETVAPQVEVTAQFNDDRMSGSSGCNSYGTSYTVDGDALTLGSNIVTTRKACLPPASNVESAYLERLPQVRSYSVDGDRLILTTTTKGADLVYRRG